MNYHMQGFYGKSKDKRKRIYPKNEEEEKNKSSNPEPSEKNIFIQKIETVKSYTYITGFKKLIKEIDQHVKFLLNEEATGHFNFNFSKGFIINGTSGSGKSIIIEAVANENNLILYKVICMQMLSSYSNKIEQKLLEFFDKLKSQQLKFLVYLQGFDLLFKKPDNKEISIINCISTIMDNLQQQNNILVFISTSFISRIDPMLRRAGRFDHEFNLGLLNMKKRVKIIKRLTENTPIDEDVSIEELARMTPGFVISDLIFFLQKASMICYFTNNSINSVRLEHFQQAINFIKPASLKEGFVDVTGMTWKSIGGLDELCQDLKFEIFGSIYNEKYFSSLGLALSTGVLLHGPPGCGKTLIAKALASESGLNFLSIRGPEIFSMYVGESERALREIFTKAQSCSPCLIFFDEIDSISGKRNSSHDDGNSSSRLVNQFLTELDGLNKRKGVFVLGATNRIDMIDPAVLRPGRFDKVRYIGLPNEHQRKNIIQAITKKGTKPKISKEIIALVANRTENFSGADLSGLINQAAKMALQLNLNDQIDFEINADIINKTLSITKRSVSDQDLLLYMDNKIRYG